MLEATARLVYDPFRHDMRKNTKWWAIANLGYRGADIIRYYQQYVEKNPMYYGENHIRLFDPSWGAHVTFSRGKPPNYISLWKKYHGKQIILKYSHIVRRSGDRGEYWLPKHFFFVNVECDELNDICQEMYGKNPHRNDGIWKFHMTIGRQHQQNKELCIPKRWVSIIE